MLGSLEHFNSGGFEKASELSRIFSSQGPDGPPGKPGLSGYMVRKIRLTPSSIVRRKKEYFETGII